MWRKSGLNMHHEAMCDIGVFGLGVMGAALARNIAGRGFAVAAYSVDDAERERFRAGMRFGPKMSPNLSGDAGAEPGAGAQSASTQGAGAQSAGAGAAPAGSFVVADTLDGFVGSLSAPRRILLMVTAGQAVDQVLDRLLPLLAPGDAVMDGGNSWYEDTERRVALAGGHGVHYMGVGVSGGERGALEGPSITAGGDREAWAICADILEAIAAKADGLPCCRYVGPGGAGHYVKMVHNGIEYGIMQVIAEAWLLMDSLPGLTGEGEAADCFNRWRTGKLSSYLIDAATAVLSKADDDGEPLVDRILDVAEQNGTGRWAVLEAMERGVYAPTISVASSMRSLSARPELRHRGHKTLAVTPCHMGQSARPVREEDLEDAVYAAILCCFSQGLELLVAASDQFGWKIDLHDVVSAWKAGCIIRAELLHRIEHALHDAYEGNLLLSAEFSPLSEEAALRRIAIDAAASGLYAPAFYASLSYYDACRAGRMPLNLIQGMRNHFGAHRFRRTDRDGLFDINWE